jgi:hypothetical protein
MKPVRGWVSRIEEPLDGCIRLISTRTSAPITARHHKTKR